jgi:hypothetical protein
MSETGQGLVDNDQTNMMKPGSEIKNMWGVLLSLMSAGQC